MLASEMCYLSAPNLARLVWLISLNVYIYRSSSISCILECYGQFRVNLELFGAYSSIWGYKRLKKTKMPPPTPTKALHRTSMYNMQRKGKATAWHRDAIGNIGDLTAHSATLFNPLRCTTISGAAAPSWNNSVELQQNLILLKRNILSRWTIRLFYLAISWCTLSTSFLAMLPFKQIGNFLSSPRRFSFFWKLIISYQTKKWQQLKLYPA